MKLKINEQNDFSSEESRNNLGISSLVGMLINKKNDLIADLNSLRLELQDAGLEDMIDIVSSIIEDENNNIGKLQHINELVSPEAKEIEAGKEEAKDILDESIRNPKNKKRHQKRYLKEDNNTYYVSHYKEEAVREEDGTTTPISKLIDFEEFETSSEARDYLADLYLEKIGDGFEKKSDILLIKSSKYVGGDEYYLLEDELGSEEVDISDLVGEE